jgi:galactokinase
VRGPPPPHLRLVCHVRSGFRDVFGGDPEVVASAPGRVNLLGEHTDYNHGYVLPTPLPLWTCVGAARLPGRVEVYSAAFQEDVSRASEELPRGHWSDYVVGCVWALRRAGFPVPGARLWVASEVPLGAGLSSSAALEVATLRALREVYGLALENVALARLAQAAEVEYVGVRCGIMDQMTASAGRPGSALFLDTRSLAWELVPLPTAYRLQVVDSGVPRRLAEAGYNQRSWECEEAARLLGVKALRDVGEEELPRLARLPEPLARRARHVVTENRRVLQGVEALRAGDLQTFGRLMVESHLSLKDDFEVSTPELDRLVEACLRHGAAGARLTGAGFGGAVVALVPEPAVDAFQKGVTGDCPATRFLV